MKFLENTAKSYDQMLDSGLRLSGFGKHHFIRQRVDFLMNSLKPHEEKQVRSILDFGCGNGDTAIYLKKCFPKATIGGTDTSRKMLRLATAKMAAMEEKISFLPPEGLEANGYDACYINGVFHHIDPAVRLQTFKMIHGLLTLKGWVAFFENNPLNPGTRAIMKRIEFDKNASLLWAGKARGLLIEAGFRCVARPRYLFFFPAFLPAPRFLEYALKNIPLGGQYFILARK